MTQAFLYLWIEKSSGKWYLGSRTAKGCNPNDGYICSSHLVRPLIEANRNNWERFIITVGDSKQIKWYEDRLLQILDARKDPNSYNRTNNDGKFGYTGESLPKEVKSKISAALKNRKKPQRSIEHSRNIVESRRRNGTLVAWNKGKSGHLTEEQIKRMSNSHIGIKPKRTCPSPLKGKTRPAEVLQKSWRTRKGRQLLGD